MKVLPIRSFGNNPGCIDESACNYNEQANSFDMSCAYPQPGYKCDGDIIPEIGSIIEGGLLFYIDQSGQHGLVADLQDLELSSWSGAISSASISTSNNFDDWYLPNIEDLNLMYNTIGLSGNKGNIGGFVDNNYWSSDLTDGGGGVLFNFSDGSYFETDPDFTYNIRAIRAF